MSRGAKPSLLFSIAIPFLRSLVTLGKRRGIATGYGASRGYLPRASTPSGCAGTSMAFYFPSGLSGALCAYIQDAGVQTCAQYVGVCTSITTVQIHVWTVQYGSHTYIQCLPYTSIQYVDVPTDIQYAGVLMHIHLYNTLMYIQIHNMLTKCGRTACSCTREGRFVNSHKVVFLAGAVVRHELHRHVNDYLSAGVSGYLQKTWQVVVSQLMPSVSQRPGGSPWRRWQVCH